MIPRLISYFSHFFSPFAEGCKASISRWFLKTQGFANAECKHSTFWQLIHKISIFRKIFFSLIFSELFLVNVGDFGGSVGVVVVELLSIVSALEGPSPDCRVGKLLQMFLWPAQNTIQLKCNRIRIRVWANNNRGLLRVLAILKTHLIFLQNWTQALILKFIRVVCHSVPHLQS